MKLIDIIWRTTSANKNREKTPSLKNCDTPIQKKMPSNNIVNNIPTMDSPSYEEQTIDDSVDIHTSLSKTEHQEASPIESPSLLDNPEYMTLAQQCCDILSELNRIQNQIKNEEVLDFITLQKSRIREALLISGATLINDDATFNLLRHQCINRGRHIENGTPITKTIEPGVEIDGRVMVKAKICLKN